MVNDMDNDMETGVLKRSIGITISFVILDSRLQAVMV